MDTKKIGLRIRSLRFAKGLKQEDLAKILKIDRSTLSKIESGINKPTARILIELNRVFSVSIDWILTGSGFKKYLETDECCHDLEELIEDISKDKILKHAVLSYFYTFKTNKEKALEKTKEMIIKNRETGGNHGV